MKPFVPVDVTVSGDHELHSTMMKEILSFAPLGVYCDTAPLYNLELWMAFFNGICQLAFSPDSLSLVKLRSHLP